MCFRCLRVLLVFAAAAFAEEHGRTLRVCADPNNLPFSNKSEQGFENRIAELLARQLGATLQYTWWSERKGFVKHTLDENRCDAVIGVPADLPGVLTTKPYYRSIYVFVSREDRNLRISSLSDPRLQDWRIGVHVVGDDYAPPAHALARRGVTRLAGYSLFGPYGEMNPPSKLIDAVTGGDVDVAIVWGPFAGYFAMKQKAPLAIVPVSPEMFMAIPFAYSISIAVRAGNQALKSELDRALERDCAIIQTVLAEYDVPQISEGSQPCAGTRQSASLSSH